MHNKNILKTIKKFNILEKGPFAIYIYIGVGQNKENPKNLSIIILKLI